MGSVIGNIECTRCGSEECFEDYYYKTGEVYISCPDCGYHYSSFIKRNDESFSNKSKINANAYGKHFEKISRRTRYDGKVF